MKKYILPLILILLLTFTLTGFCWVAGYDQRVKLTIDHTKIDTANLTNFPVTAFFTAAQAEEIFAEFDADEDFDRGQFALENDTLLKAEKELFDDSESLGVYHIKIPTVLYNADTDYYFYYDNDADHNTSYIGVIGSATAAEVWVDYAAVYHMVDNTASTILDSTSNNNDGTKTGANNPLQAVGKVGFGQDFSSDKITIPYGASIDLDQYASISISAIVDYTSSEIFHIWVTSYSTSDFVYLRINADGKVFFRLYQHEPTPTDQWIWESDDAISAGFHHIVVTHTNGSDPIMYVDGTSVAFTQTYGQNDRIRHTSPRDSFLGAHYLDNDYTSGIMDELQLSGTIRNASWIKATYNSLWDNLITYGAEETEEVEEANATFFGFAF